MKLTTKHAVSLRQKALDLLSRREHSEAELSQKLKAYAQQHGLEVDEIGAVLADFKSRKWLSDARYTEQMVNARQRKFGALRVAHELREKGVEDSLIAQAVETLGENEDARAREIWRKKFKAAPQSREEWAKQARFLQGRGFSFDVIKRVIRDNEEE